ncbi:PRTRC system protein C [Paraburkholderia sp. USG1]|uniref:PRTRC system protein C n=1 Tax=Paraburkholderia sp. USG1 TaxID=2952268 RepID=UPI0028592658|nr:PRTRC system protein C [Paraburkholderia sp. USG1]MDR8398245.1 PRTRC system protein C [Paraburkholderia sp. USG1]
MKTETLAREFRYNGAKLTDPSPTFSLQQVRDFYGNTYPEIVNAEIEGPEVVGNKNVFTFRRAVGTKGAEDELISVRKKIGRVLQNCRRMPPSITTYLVEVERFAGAHVCPLLDEEVAFIDALYARYVTAACALEATS